MRESLNVFAFLRRDPSQYQSPHETVGVFSTFSAFSVFSGPPPASPWNAHALITGNHSGVREDRYLGSADKRHRRGSVPQPEPKKRRASASAPRRTPASPRTVHLRSFPTSEGPEGSENSQRFDARPPTLEPLSHLSHLSHLRSTKPPVAPCAVRLSNADHATLRWGERNLLFVGSESGCKGISPPIQAGPRMAIDRYPGGGCFEFVR